MSINTPQEDTEFHCDKCDKDYKLKNLVTEERSDKITYTCPVCDESIYETVLNRNVDN